MAAMMREMNKGGKLLWIAPSGGRDRPDPSGQILLGAFPVKFAWAVGPVAGTRLGAARGLLLPIIFGPDNQELSKQFLINFQHGCCLCRTGAQLHCCRQLYLWVPIVGQPTRCGVGAGCQSVCWLQDGTSLLDMLLWCRAMTAALLNPGQGDPAASERAGSYSHPLLLLLLLQGGGYPTALTPMQWS